MMISESDLAARWAISPKTLQRWRTDKRALPYVKIGKCVRYRLDDVSEYETQRHKAIVKEAAKPAIPTQPILVKAAPAEDMSQTQVSLRHDAGPAVIDGELISAKDAIRLTQLPAYYFRNRIVRENLGVPHYMVGRLVRFKSAELHKWEMQYVCKQEAAQPARQPAAPEPPRMGLHEALRRLNDGTLLK